MRLKTYTYPPNYIKFNDSEYYLCALYEWSIGKYIGDTYSEGKYVTREGIFILPGEDIDGLIDGSDVECRVKDETCTLKGVYPQGGEDYIVHPDYWIDAGNTVSNNGKKVARLWIVRFYAEEIKYLDKGENDV